MEKRKIIIICIGILLMVLAACVGKHFLKDNPIQQKNTIQEEELETYEKESLSKNETHFVDETETLNAEEKEKIQAEALEVIQNFYGTMFEFSDQTQDYTEQLKSYYGTSELFKTSDIGEVGNIYTLFQDVHMQSSFEDYQIERIIYRKNTKVPEISVIGSIQTSFQHDKMKKGEYSVISNIVLCNENGTWQIFSDHVSNVYQKGKMEAYKDRKDTLHDGLTYKGMVLDIFDFSDVEGYLTDYNYGDKEVQEVKESGLTVMD